MKKSIQSNDGISLLLPDCAKEVEERIKKGFLPEKAAQSVYNSHPLLKNVLKNPQQFLLMLKEKFPRIFPAASSQDIRDAAQRFLRQGGDRDFLEDISSQEEYTRALNALL